MEPILAIDLGCTKFIVGVADGEGRELARETGPTPGPDGGDAGVETLSSALERCCAKAALRAGDALALGVGAPGPLERPAGVLLSPPQLPWGDYPLGPALRERLGVRTVVIDNDCKAGGLGEYTQGAGRGAKSMVYFGVGTGIGGCVIIDGAIQYGASDNASEIGHLCVWMGGPTCGCGNDGCLEGIASGSGIERRAQELARTGKADALLAAAGGDLSAITGALITEAETDGDPVAARIWDDAQRALGAGCASMINALSPDVIVLGGGIPARHGDAYIARIAQEARRRSLGPNKDATRIVGAQLGMDSVLIGAIEMARTAALADQ